MKIPINAALSELARSEDFLVFCKVACPDVPRGHVWALAAVDGRPVPIETSVKEMSEDIAKLIDEELDLPKGE